jgi:quercetin dioxygenase-like cupin family protein
MNTTDFETGLRRDGYNDVFTKELPAGQSVAEHNHPFDVHALVLNGEITLTVDGVASTYREGDKFTMAAGCRHQEDVGPEGVSYLVGRRHPQ